MKGETAFSPGQMGELQSIVSVSVSTALPKVAAKLGDPKAVLKALKNKGEVLAGHLEGVIEQAIGRMLVLIPREPVSLTLVERHNPDAYYRNRSGLYVWDDFRSRVVTKAKPVEKGMAIDAEVYELGRDATDKEIEDALPKNHLFDESTLCAIVAELVDKQPGGKAGDLENTGRVNLFYTSSCVVFVYWSASVAGWYVSTWHRDGRRWRAGRRVFSPAN